MKQVDKIERMWGLCAFDLFLATDELDESNNTGAQMLGSI